MAKPHRASATAPLRPKNNPGRDLPIAVAVGVGLAAVVVIAAGLGPVGWYPAVAVVIGLATWEVTARLCEAGFTIPRWALLAGGQAIVWSTLPFGVFGLASSFVAVALIVMYLRLFQSEGSEHFIRDVGVSIFVLTWIPVFGAFAALISKFDSVGAPSSYFIITFMACVVASDTGGYCAGVLFGSHPMAPRVSPKKSWEGFAGSVVAAAIVGAVCVSCLLNHSWLVGAVLGPLLAVCATLGDLVESQFKRDLKIKDMSALLPGHGGMMDRLDGVLPAAMVTWLLLGFAG